ncbi:MAG: HD domain-containing protein [Myxococcota bacterium]|jgi:HD superfamily phosphohydrolase|nr:HD domain-containing protein [Myxococcota bacterium]
MELRDPVHGSIEVLLPEVAILDHPVFQRLRSIKQLGFSQFSFPGVTHTRLSHCLGTMHLATLAFDSIFDAHFSFQHPANRRRLRETVRLAALLHDLGHPPLSHCTEVAMPSLAALQIACYRPTDRVEDRQANHEDVSVLLMTASSLAATLPGAEAGVTPRHVAALISSQVPIDDDYFVDGDRDFRPILSQIVSSECDVDRMDYLARDSLFAGVRYGAFDQSWLLRSLTWHVGEGGAVQLALDSRGLYAFDHFLIARYHMFLIVYYHARSVIFEEMLRRYLEERPDEYRLPVEPEAYRQVDDTQLMASLRTSDSRWARRIVEARPYGLLVERHGSAERVDLAWAVARLDEAGIDHISVSSRGVLSKYVGKTRSLAAPPIWVVDRSRALAAAPRTLDQATDLFARYGEERQIGRVYVELEDRERAAALCALAPGA